MGAGEQNYENMSRQYLLWRVHIEPNQHPRLDQRNAARSS